MKRWLAVPNSMTNITLPNNMTNITLHSSHTKVTLPVKYLVEEFKVSKARSFMTLRDSKDSVV